MLRAQQASTGVQGGGGGGPKVPDGGAREQDERTPTADDAARDSRTSDSGYGCVIKYINRLSDYFFMAARYSCQFDKQVCLLYSCGLAACTAPPFAYACHLECRLVVAGRAGLFFTKTRGVSVHDHRAAPGAEECAGGE